MRKSARKNSLKLQNTDRNATGKEVGACQKAKSWRP